MKKIGSVISFKYLLLLLIVIVQSVCLFGQNIRKEIKNQTNEIKLIEDYIDKHDQNLKNWSEKIRITAQTVDSLLFGVVVKQHRSAFVKAAEFHSAIFNLQLKQLSKCLIDSLIWNTSLIKSYDYYLMAYEESTYSGRKKIDKVLKELNEKVSMLIVNLNMKKSYDHIMFYSDFLTLMNITICEYYCIPNPKHDFYEANRVMSKGIYKMHYKSNKISSYFDVFDNGIYTNDTYKLLINICKYKRDTLGALAWIADSKRMNEFNLELLIEEVIIYNEQNDYNRSIDTIKSFIRKNDVIGGKELMASVYTEYSNHLLKKMDIKGAIKLMKIARNISLNTGQNDFDSELRIAKACSNLFVLYEIMVTNAIDMDGNIMNKIERLRSDAYNDAIIHYKKAHDFNSNNLEPIEAIVDLYRNSFNASDSVKINFYLKKIKKIKKK